MKLKNLIPLIPVAAIAATMFISHSCANTTTAPSGGPKDTIPPMLVGVKPYPGTLNVPVSCKQTKIVFTFDEYVVVKNPKNIFLSPPLSKSPKAKTKGKSVVVSFEEDLHPNTTYTIDITGAINDNNEGNPFPGYSLVFSTGDQIDSMYVTGVVQDCSTLKPMKNATVMLYKDQADSAIFLHLPDAAVKTDDWGYFCIRNIKDTTYRLYALADKNSNNMYDPESEMVAFNDSTVTPVHKAIEGTYELYKFDMRDTASCMKRKKDYELNLFKALPSKQVLINKGRIGDKTAFVTFMAPDAKINSLKFKGISDKKLIKMFNAKRDSMVIWINNPRALPDTLFMTLDYMKTDSLGKLVRSVEKHKLFTPKKKQLKSFSSKKEIKHEDTIAVYTVGVTPETFEQYGISISFQYPLVKEAFDKLKYEITNPRKKVEQGKYTVERDSIDMRKVTLRHVGRILPGYEYALTVPQRVFKDINGHYNDSLRTSIKLPDDDKLCRITLNVNGIEGNRYIIDIMNQKRDKVLRSYTVQKNCTLDFPYLSAGKYCFRVTEDKNFNNIVDTGDLLKHLQPEKVRFYSQPGGSIFLSLPESSEIVQDINIKDIFAK